MATDILEITNQVLELFKQYELTHVQTMFVIEAVKLSVNEEIIRETIQDMRKGYDSLPGVQ
jgi:hypothetical protein